VIGVYNETWSTHSVSPPAATSLVNGRTQARSVSKQTHTHSHTYTAYSLHVVPTWTSVHLTMSFLEGYPLDTCSSTFCVCMPE
jgi:hypothetical protein